MKTIKIRDLNPYRYKDVSVGGKDRYIEYKNLFLNNISIIRKSSRKPLEYPKERFIKNTLFEDSYLGFSKSDDLPTRVSKLNNFNELGDPTKANFVYGNGTSEIVNLSYDKEGNFYVLDAFVDTYSIATLIKDAIAEIDTYHNAKIQNIKACKTPYIIACKDDKVRLSLFTAIQQQQDENKPVIVVDKDIGENLVSIKTNVEFIADKYDELEDKAKDKLLNKLGIMSANINKKERVQVGEVNATLGQCLDYIYAMIDTFNKQCETYGIDLEMIDNTSLGEYEKQAQEGAKEGNTNENETNENETN